MDIFGALKIFEREITVTNLTDLLLLTPKFIEYLIWGHSVVN